jgi:hypothetical protein
MDNGEVVIVCWLSLNMSKLTKTASFVLDAGVQALPGRSKHINTVSLPCGTQFLCMYASNSHGPEKPLQALGIEWKRAHNE